MAGASSIPLSIDLHKGRQPLSVGFAATEITFLFGEEAGAGRRSRRSKTTMGDGCNVRDRIHSSYTDFESSLTSALEGVARWPWFNAGGDGPSPGDLYLIERP